MAGYGSILNPQIGSMAGADTPPDRLRDLDDDQIVPAMTAGHDDAGLAGVVDVPLLNLAAVPYRQRTFGDLEGRETRPLTKTFVDGGPAPDPASTSKVGKVTHDAPIRDSETKMKRTRGKSRRQVLSVWVAGVALAVAMLGQSLLSAPPASAACSLTPQDDQYVHLLAMDKMVHTADYTDCHMSAEGRWFANRVRSSADPLGTARSLMKMVTDTTPMSASQAEWEIESAIYVYAPKLIPTIKDEFARQG